MKQSITAEAQAQARTLIRTFLVAEHNLARLISFAEEGVTVIEWTATIDDATTPECLELDGKQWQMPPDPINYAAYEPIGHDLPFPGPIGPHIWNCRSTQVPVDEEGAFLALPLAMEVAT